MKNILLISFILFAFFAKSQTSVYHPMPDSNAVWNIESSFQCWTGVPVTVITNYSIMLSGDTVINSQIYHKLSVPFIQTDSTACSSAGIILNVYKGAIRQDTTNRKVFIVPPFIAAEQLLYDFTMQVGDTVKGYLESSAFPTDTVQSIDSVIVGTSYRKRWQINSCYNLALIEGVGSTFGLVEHSPGCQSDWTNYTTLCFQQNGQSLYPNITANCQLITSIASPDKTFDELKIFPNPTSDVLNIISHSNEKYFMNIYNSLGEKIYSTIATANCRLSSADWSSGIYFLQVRTGNKFKSMKFIKQ